MVMWRRKANPKTGKHTLCEPAHRNAHGHFTRASLCDNLQETCRTLIPGHTFCASLRSRNAHGHCTRAIFVWKFTGQMLHTNSGACVLCQPAQSKRRWTFQKRNFVWKFKGKVPDPQRTTSIEHRALAGTVRTRSVRPHCLGKNEFA